MLLRVTMGHSVPDISLGREVQGQMTVRILRSRASQGHTSAQLRDAECLRHD
jgi:hypothetical protein